jgi:DNA-binding transcriptional ArsR family regulator
MGANGPAAAEASIMATLKNNGKKPGPRRTSPAPEASGRATNGAATANGLARTSALLKVVADPVRLGILATLADGAMGAEELSERVGASLPSVNRHLALLRSHQLIGPGRRGSRDGDSLTERGEAVVALLRRITAPWPDRPREAEGGAEIDPNLLYDVGGFVDDPETWFRTPNAEFGGRRPVDLLGTDEEPRLRNRIGAAKLGMFS